VRAPDQIPARILAAEALESAICLGRQALARSPGWAGLTRDLAVLRLRAAARRMTGPAGPARLAGLDVRHDDILALALFAEEIFAREVYRTDLPTRAPRILDCGSNLGLSVLYFRRLYPGARITAFEPDPRLFELLSENVAASGATAAEVRCVHAAVTGAAGEVELYRNPARPGSGLAPSALGGRSEGVRVSTVALSSFVDGPIDLIKMDIEGAEEATLDELAASGKLALVGELVIEYHHHLDRGQDRFSHLLATLERAGFGYQLSVRARSLLPRRRFQDVLVLAYRKP
jgi:FkbM family methyltransferase